MKRMIEVRFQFEGSHYWPDAPLQVAFLRTPHRHMFHVRARMNVTHDDRELEFIMVKWELQSIVSTWGFYLGTMSCEQMAAKLIEYILAKYKRIEVEVEVNEDGENGAILSTVTPL